MSARNKCVSLDPAATARQRGHDVQVPVSVTNDMCDVARNKYYLASYLRSKVFFIIICSDVQYYPALFTSLVSGYPCCCCCCCCCSFETPPQKRIPRIFALFNSVPGKPIPKLPRESAMAVQFSSPESRLRSLAERQTVAISQLIKADSGRSFLARAERVSRSLRRRSRPISIR